MAKTVTPSPDRIFGEDLATFGAGIKTIDGTPAIDDLENEMQTMPHLTEDRRLEVAGVQREFRDCRKIRLAAEALGRIPGPDQEIHLVIAGFYALWDFVPAILQLAAPAMIENLHICTLGYSRQNIVELCSLIDSGQVRGVSLLGSHYFKGSSGDLYEFGRAELAKRPQAKFLSLRNHAKMIAMALGDGRFTTILSSANMRSCKNSEICICRGDPGVYRFYTGWVNQLFADAAGQESQP